MLGADEKSQYQALDRTQPSLPIVPGRCGTMTHDYKRDGTTTLFAAIEMAHGRAISTCMPRHRNQGWIRFPALIDAETPPELDLRLIVDDLSTHKHPTLRRWLKRHPRFHMHFTPTSSSWLNAIERFFRDLTDRRLWRGAFRTVQQIIQAIDGYIAAHSTNPRPFVWTRTAEEILQGQLGHNVVEPNSPAALQRKVLEVLHRPSLLARGEHAGCASRRTFEEHIGGVVGVHEQEARGAGSPSGPHLSSVSLGRNGAGPCTG